MFGIGNWVNLNAVNSALGQVGLSQVGPGQVGLVPY